MTYIIDKVGNNLSFQLSATSVASAAQSAHRTKRRVSELRLGNGWAPPEAPAWHLEVPDPVPDSLGVRGVFHRASS